MENRLIKAVFIDIDNTLLDFNKSAKEAVKSSFLQENLEYDESVFDTFTKINDAMWLDIEKGVLTKEMHSKIRWKRIFEALGIERDGESFEEVFIHHLNRSAIPVDGAGEMLEYLSGKYTLYAASNGSQSQQEGRLEIAGFLKYFKDVFTSGRMGFHKPDVRFFEGCFTEIPYSKQEVMLIGDSLSADVKGGKDFGIKCCWFNFFNIPCPEEAKPDFEIYSPEEITKIM